LRKKIFHNLEFAFGNDISAPQRKEIAKKVLQNSTKNWGELVFSVGPAKGKIFQKINIFGKDNLDQALSRGRGVIAISAHLGNYALIGSKLTETGYHFAMVVRDLKSKIGSSIYEKSRELLGFHSIATMPARKFYKEALHILNNNGILCLIADENKRYGGIYVDFFGHPASTAPGPSALALRTGSPIIPIFIFRDSDNSHNIIIEKEITWEATGNATQDMQNITVKFTQIIEEYVRRDPSQWTWTTWRWRTQPWGKLDRAGEKRKTRWLKKIRRRLKR
jgi:KDO2-lipid IV(A) lauroyltransferase